MILARFTIENPGVTNLNFFSFKPKVITEPKEVFGFVIRAPKEGSVRTFPGLSEKLMVVSAKPSRLFRLDIVLRHEYINQ